jgi:hypothetical protein
MRHRNQLRAALYSSLLVAALASTPALAQQGFAIDPSSWSECIGATSCAIGQATVSAIGGQLAEKTLNDSTGLGVSGGPSGEEIDIGETLQVEFDEPRTVAAIQVLFLFNGPEFDDQAEVAKITADGVTYTLAVGNDADDASASWDGAGSVESCGTTTESGTGCFLINGPFAAPVSELSFTAAPGGPPAGGEGGNESDFSLGFIDVTSGVLIDLDDCATPEGCVIARVNGEVAVSVSSLEFTDDDGNAHAQVFRVRLPDCRYIPQTCRTLLGGGTSTVTDNAAREFLIAQGVIKPLDPGGSNRLKPAAQLLNATPLLPPEVTSLFDSSGQAPNGLPPLLIGARWRGQNENGYFFDALFFKVDPDVVFRDTFEGLIDVSRLTGQELGCFAVSNDLLAWDVITAVSETYKSLGGRYIDTMTNVGCINPTKISGVRWSLYPVNLEVTPDTYAPTVKTSKATVTVNNDAVFARLVQSLWDDVGESRRVYACKQADSPSGQAPISSGACKKLALLWEVAELKINLCVAASFLPRNRLGDLVCALARHTVQDYAAVLPATATGTDVANRLGEQKARVETWLHVWDTRYVPSIKANGFCRETNKCPP